jgi:hypothetical protein
MMLTNQAKKFVLKTHVNSFAGIALVGVVAVGNAFAWNTNTVRTSAIGTVRTCTKTTVTAAVGQRRGRNWDGYPNLGGSLDLRQTALNAGYNEGSKEGRKDRDKRTFRNYSDFKSYRNADQDYSSKLGDRDLYHRYYRMAFESGYDTENPSSYQQTRDRDRDRDYDRDRDREHRGRNWGRYGTYGGSTELRHTALNAGYNAGIKEGRNDGKKNRHRNYSDFGAYQKATDDYNSNLGDRELYRRYYREGFENGYEDGYRGN